MVRINAVLDYLAYGIALLGYVPLFPHLELLPRALFPAALAAGIIADRRDRQIRGLLPTAISLICFVFYATRFTRDNLVGPAVNLLVVLMAVRLLSGKSARHYLQIYALALFSLAGSSLFSLSPLFLCYFLLMLVLIAVSLVMLTFHSSSSAPVLPRAAMARIVSVACLLPAASLPLILLFFFILPRTQYPLWNFLNAGGAKVTGLSDKVAPGSAPAVEEVRNVAFRAKCGILPKEHLYWRGIVLNAFDGNAWVRREPPGAEDGIAVGGETVRQTIFPEPGRSPWLPALNLPRGISGIRFTAGPDAIYLRRGGAAGHEKYEAESVPGGTIIPKRGIDEGFYLKLPGRLSPRMAALGREIARKGKSAAEKVDLLEGYYRAARLSYATSALPVGEEPLDQFLFDRKRGNCEFFASSFATLLRVAGVPARLVGGYYGGSYNELGGYYAVTEDMAHVWVEALVAGKGWVTIDPSRWGGNFSGSGEREQGIARTVVMVLDALGYYWNLAVINYDLERQVRLVTRAGGELKRLRAPANLPLVLAALLVPVLLAGGVFALLRRGRLGPEERILGSFLREVRRTRGVAAGPATGLHELAVALADPLADRFVEIYAAAVYRDRRLTPGEIRELKRLVRGLRNRSGGSVLRPGQGTTHGGRSVFHKP